MGKYRIIWDIDPECLFWKLESIGISETVKILEISEEIYLSMSLDEREEFASDFFRRHPEAFSELMNLPGTAVFNGAQSDDDVANSLSDEFGFLVESFQKI